LFIPFLMLLLCETLATAALVLSINKETQQMDWVGGFSITRFPTGIDDNRFGIMATIDAQVLSPLLSYSGQGSHFGVHFDLSLDRTAIDGIGLLTTFPPGTGASFSGTPEGPVTPSFLLGNFSLFAGLNNGDYTLAPVGPWSDGIRVVVVPEPATSLLWALAMGIFVGWRARNRGLHR